MLKNLKAEEERKARLIRSSLLNKTSHQFEEVNHLMWGGALVVLLLTIIIIRNLVRLYRNDRTIVRYAALTTENAAQKGEFLAQITHEIRTPLNSIIGFAQLMDAEQLNGQNKESVEAIQSSSRILVSLVNELLDFSKLEQGKLNLHYQAFSPVVPLQEVTALLSVLAGEKRIRLVPQFDLKPDLFLMGDDFRIRQVVINLLNNAIKFTPPQGTVTISAVAERVDQQKKLLKISVKDTGIGIAPENLKLIFEDFSQVETPGAGRQGTGLGLAICKRIVELHGGTISVESTVGKGSEFKVSIPLAVAVDAAKPKMPAPPVRVELKGKKALVADDTRLNLVLMSRLLEKHGLTFDLVNSGEDALELFEKQPYDIVITDIHMPGMGGAELTRVIRRSADTGKARTPVIVFTGDSSDRDKSFYAGLGISAVLGKPFSENEFLNVLGQALR